MPKLFFIIKENPYFLTVIIIVSLILGLALGLIVSREDEKVQQSEKHVPGYTYISPLLECYSNKSDSPENNKLKNKIEYLLTTEIREKKITEASVYFRDLANGPWIGINENKEFTPASLLKVPILITYYKMAENNPEILKQLILTDAANQGFTTPNIRPAKTIEVGKKYSVEELLEAMIIQSDNFAANTLLSKLSEEGFAKIFNDLGLSYPNIYKTEDFMSVKDYASFFRILYNASYLDKFYSEKALKLLASSEFNLGLTAGLPENIEIAHKFGERKNNDIEQLHDCGIIYKQNKDYLLCVMTRGTDFDNLADVISDISKLVYENVN